MYADGTVAPLGAGWTTSWGVGVGRRWHVASEQVAVRTRLMEDMPVVSTAMRVGSGDVVQTVTATAESGSKRALVLEYSNKSNEAVSLAIAILAQPPQQSRNVRRFLLGPWRTPSRRGGGLAQAQMQGQRISANGEVVAHLPTVPGGTAASASAAGIWEAVRNEPPRGDIEIHASDAKATASVAAITPLVGGTSLHVVLLLDGLDGQAVGPRESSQVVRGWLAVTGTGAEVQLPDETAGRAWRRGIAAAILAAGHDSLRTAPKAAVLLDCVGLADEADRARAIVFERIGQTLKSPALAVATLRALASRRLRAGRDSGLGELAGPLVEAASDHLDVATIEQLTSVLDIESPATAGDARELFDELNLADARASARSVASGRDDSEPLLRPERSGADNPQHEERGLAQILAESIAIGGDGMHGLEALLGCLVTERSDSLVLAPALAPNWIGGSIDVRSLMTRHGRLSYSLRWHGTRPALLWELSNKPASRTKPKLLCGLDSGWQTRELSGEALLA